MRLNTLLASQKRKVIFHCGNHVLRIDKLRNGDVKKNESLPMAINAKWAAVH